MQKTISNQQAKSAHRTVRTSTTLSRKYVKRPTKTSEVQVSIKKPSKISHFSNDYTAKVQSTKMQRNIDQPMEPAQVHPLQVKATERMNQRNNFEQERETPKMTAKELKDQAIKKALASAVLTEENTNQKSAKKTKKEKSLSGARFSFGRLLLALGCTAIAVFAIVSYVNVNMPDISLRVAAMQTGIEASYPGYVPRDYHLTDITSEEGKITLNFSNSNTGETFSLVEEKSSWDSNALLTNFVKAEYGEDYSVVKEQGLTIYMNDNKATWVNGGIVYKITGSAEALTKKQTCSIAVSLQ